MPTNLEKLILKAEKLRNQNKLSDALPIYKKICKTDTKNKAAWMIYGSLAGNSNKLDEAEYAFNKAVELSHEFDKSHEYLVQVYEIQEKYDLAIQTLLDLQSYKNAPSDLKLRIGILYGKSNDFNSSIQWVKKHIENDNNNPHAYYCLASAYEALAYYEKAEKYYKSAIELNRSDFQLCNSYGAMLHKLGKLEQARKQYQRSIELNNQYHISHYNLANVYHHLGKYQKALKLFSTALQLKPDYTEAIVGSGKCHYSMNANSRAIELFKNAIKLNKKHHDAYANMCHAYIALGDFSSAEKAIQKAAELEPDDIETKCTLAQLYEKQGMFDKTEEIVRPLLKSDPDNVDVILTYASICKKTHECDIAINLINNAITDEFISPVKKTTLHYSAGKILDSLKNYSEAFDHFESANKLQSFSNDKSLTNRSLTNIKNLFSKSAMEALPRSSITSDAPIFIVGMPRSGTTLVEQIIASHPDVFGAGELPYLDSLSKVINGNFISGEKEITSLNTISPSLLTSLADKYLTHVYDNKNDKANFTDKMPHNFRLIGLISIMFPNAKIIHCTRNPIDNCLSIYFSHFNSSHPYANYLDDLAKYYIDYYQSLMTHWNSVKTIPIYEVNYENLVNNQREVTYEMLKFCNLEWSDNCLDFHKSSREVATISYDQVRQPMYNKSISRWKNYEAHIAALLKHFKEHM